MPRRRTSNKPIKRRIKLNTMQDVQSELGKVYRAVDAGNMSPAEGTRRVFMLDKIRASGLPDARARAGNGYVAPAIHVFSMPSGFFFSMAQIEAMKRGEPIIDASQCTPILLEHEPALPAFDSAPVTIEIDAKPSSIVTFPYLVSESPDDGDHVA